MLILQKCLQDTRAEDARRAGVYPYFHCLESRQDVEVVMEWAFARCSSLKSITIPDSVTEIGYSAFGDCSSLKEIVVDSRDEIPRIKELMKNSKSNINVESLEFMKTNKVSPTPTLSQKFCTECGAKIEGKGKFCPEFGTRL